MSTHVLGIGYTQSPESIAKIGIWKRLGLELDCTDDFDHAACMLSNREYTCVAICMNAISEDQLEALRKAQSSLLYANGVSLKEIQEWLGHSGISTTSNIYTHLDFSSKVSSANAIVNIFPENTKV